MPKDSAYSFLDSSNEMFFDVSALSPDSDLVGSKVAILTAPILTADVQDILGPAGLPRTSLCAGVISQHALGLQETSRFREMFLNTSVAVRALICGSKASPSPRLWNTSI